MNSFQETADTCPDRDIELPVDLANEVFFQFDAVLDDFHNNNFWRGYLFECIISAGI